MIKKTTAHFGVLFFFMSAEMRSFFVLSDVSAAYYLL